MGVNVGILSTDSNLRGLSMTQRTPVDQMGTDELAAEYELLASDLPSMRHLPTVTLNIALALAEKARHGTVTAQEHNWIRQLAAYSAQHALRFVETTRRMAELLTALAVDDPDYKPDMTRQVHPVFNYGELLALVSAQRAFSAACDTFVGLNAAKDSMLGANFATDVLQRLDAEAIQAAEQLAEAFPTPSTTTSPTA